MVQGRVLGIDAGERRVGVALSDELRVLASPLFVLDRGGGLAPVLEALADVARREGVAQLVVGLPLNADGSEGRQARRAQEFARVAARVVGIPVAMWDERLSTQEAEAIVRAQGRNTRRLRQQGKIDAVAAAVILQDYLDHARSLTRPMFARLLVVLFALLVIGAGAAIGYYVLGDSTPILGTRISQLADPLAAVDPQDTTPQVVTIPPGASASDIGADLQQRGLIRSGLAFRIAAEQAGVGSSLAAGDYELSKSMSTDEIIQVLAKGQVKRGLVATIPEGWRSEQIANRLEATGFASRDEFMKAVGAPQTVPGFDLLGQNPPPARLEGYLFPETYEVPQKVPGANAAEMMIRMFNQRVADEIKTQNQSKLTPEQVVILASIVEREAKQASERPTIAGVYLNRLAADMPLQADPTVQYAVATRDGPAAAAYNYWKLDLTADDLAIDSPFNTYLVRGLPPAPICNPGEASIQAVLRPAKTDFMFFVATTDGSGTHLFARTLAEHNANVANAEMGSSTK